MSRPQPTDMNRPGGGQPGAFASGAGDASGPIGRPSGDAPALGSAAPPDPSTREALGRGPARSHSAPPAAAPDARPAEPPSTRRRRALILTAVVAVAVAVLILAAN